MVPKRVRRRETLLLCVVGVAVVATAGRRIVAVVLVTVRRVRRHERCVRHQRRSRFCVPLERERSPAEQRRGGGGGGGSGAAVGGGSLIARVVREGTAVPRGLHVGARVGGGRGRGALTFLRPFDHDVDRQDVLRDKQRLPVRRSDPVLVIVVDRDAVPRAVVLARKELEAFRAFDCAGERLQFLFLITKRPARVGLTFSDALMRLDVRLEVEIPSERPTARRVRAGLHSSATLSVSQKLRKK